MQFDGLYLNIWFIEKKSSVPFRFRKILVDINILSYYKKIALVIFYQNLERTGTIPARSPSTAPNSAPSGLQRRSWPSYSPSSTHLIPLILPFIVIPFYGVCTIWLLVTLTIFHGLWHGYWLWTLRFLSRLVLSQFLTCDLWNVSKFLVIFSINDFMYAKKAEVSHEKIHWNKKMHALSVL